MTLLPTMIVNSEKKDKPLGIRDYLGWALWVAGFLMEATADYQKTVFKADPDNAVCTQNINNYSANVPTNVAN